MLPNNNPLFKELEKVVNKELVGTSEGLGVWTTKVAEEFHNIDVKTLIEDEYFLNLKHNLYPFHYETILEIYRERKKRKLDLVILNEGIGSGKNYLAATLEWLEWYYYITTPDRKKVWPHIDPNTTTAFILLSKTERESRKIVFEYVFRLFQSKFNREYFPPDTKTTTSLKIPRSKTLIFPGTGEAASALCYRKG